MAQRKLTEPLSDVANDLPDLTPYQMKFVECLLKGMSAADSYRAAYNTENMGQNSIWVEASRLKSHPSVALWLDAARANGLATAALTLDNHLQELERLKSLCVKTGNLGAAVQAEQLRGKAAGHYVEKHADVTQPTDVIGTLKQIAEHSPDLASQLAAQHGIEWKADDRATKH